MTQDKTIVLLFESKAINNILNLPKEVTGPWMNKTCSNLFTTHSIHPRSSLVQGPSSDHVEHAFGAGSRGGFMSQGGVCAETVIESSYSFFLLKSKYIW